MDHAEAHKLISRKPKMRIDWALTGSVGGVVILAGAVAGGVVSLIRSTPEPVRAPVMVPILLIENPTLPASTSQPTILTDTPSSFEKQPSEIQSAPVKDVGKVASLHPYENSVPARIPGAVKSAPQPHTQAAREQWKVTATARASTSNLGGHIDKNCMVDSVASSHLKDAFKAHMNYRRLPRNIRIDIESENINLCKVAPYRTLLGIDDKRIEEEQGIMFVRVVGIGQ